MLLSVPSSFHHDAALVIIPYNRNITLEDVSMEKYALNDFEKSLTFVNKKILYTQQGSHLFVLF